jgi:hypothetical protein
MRVTHGFRAKQIWQMSGFVSDIKDCYWELRDQACRSKLADRPVRWSNAQVMRSATLSKTGKGNTAFASDESVPVDPDYPESDAMYNEAAGNGTRSEVIWAGTRDG